MSDHEKMMWTKKLGDKCLKKIGNKEPWIIIVGGNEGKPFGISSNLHGRNHKDTIGKFKMICNYLVVIASNLRCMVLASYLNHDDTQN